MKVKIGDRFGRLVILSREENRGSSARWLVRCDCGKEKTIWQQQITGGNRRFTKSCGCLALELNKTRNLKHGACRSGQVTALYGIWVAMRGRCRNPNAAGYATHGGRGISVCKQWESFEQFAEDVGIRPSSLHSLDRINNDGNYEPGNVRWATEAQQQRNTRRNRFVKIGHERLCLTDAAKRLGIARSTLRRRLRVMSEEDAVRCGKYQRPSHAR